jgi:hypothetical protein
MLLTSADVASLDSLLSWWEKAEYAAEAFVILGCVGEFIAEFTKIGTQESRHQLSKLSLLVLIAALAIELGALVRTNRLSGQEITLLNSITADAQTQISSARERTAQLEKEAETERLERTRLETLVAPRRLTLEQQKAIAKSCYRFSGHTVIVSSYALDTESRILGEQICSALQGAKINCVLNLGSLETFGKLLSGIRVLGSPSQHGFVSAIESSLRNDGHLEIAGPEQQIVPQVVGNRVEEFAIRTDQPVEATIFVGVKLAVLLPHP